MTTLRLPLLLAMMVATCAACSNQGEGQRCSKLAGNNGNDDCEPGLSCHPELELCCPTTRAPTVAECSQTSVTFDAGRDTSSTVDVSIDAVEETEPDTSTGDESTAEDAPPDVPAEANEAD